jgi:hypothetical protein
MTENDKRRQKADLLLEYEETKNLIAHLNEAAQQRKERIHAVSRWLEESRYFEHNAFERANRFEDLNARIEQDRESYRSAMDFDRAEGIVKQLEEAITKLADLKQRKEALGLK